MRKLQAVWEQIKLDGSATILCEPNMHKRLILALRKEKNIDYGWKLLIAEQHKRAKLKEKIDGNKIFFYLEYSIIINQHTL